MSPIPCIVSLVGRKESAIECSAGAGCREHERLSERVMRAKKLSVANQEGAAKATSSILSLRSPNRMWQTRRKSALFPHCCRIATFFVSSLDAALPLVSCNLRARRFLFPTIPIRRTLSVTNVTSLVFIFFVRRPAELALRRNGDTFWRLDHATFGVGF
jgi:hypothetical protein